MNMIIIAIKYQIGFENNRGRMVGYKKTRSKKKLLVYVSWFAFFQHREHANIFMRVHEKKRVERKILSIKL